jgi:CheY-like chemotaxis protein
VDHAADGTAAVRYLESRRKKDSASGRLPDLVLLDIGLPGLNGFEVLQWLSSQPELGKNTRAIFLSNSVNPEHEQEARKLHAAGYWMKPASLKAESELMENLKKQLLDLKAAARGEKASAAWECPHVKVGERASEADASVSKRKVVQPEKDFFLDPKGENLRKAILRKPERLGEILLLIVAIRGRKGRKKRHFGLAGFYLS